jgi:predicted RNA-binding protein with PUA-like domain
VPAHWLIKSEPSEYAFARLQSDGRAEWTGVRNFEARNNLRAMAVGDLCLYYHSMQEKAVVGVARVSRGARPDPTAPGEDWASVKRDSALKDFQLLTRSRLSVARVTPAQFSRVLALSRQPEAPAAAPRRKRPVARRSSSRRPRAR